ncbi:MAG TPA: glycine/sarcosine/betaine reductase component B subunit [Acidimicrobiales bacterium]|nr:glycine/sarcosine/betaine reductase component B subunit [Acidimicrobiales bacterium]
MADSQGATEGLRRLFHDVTAVGLGDRTGYESGTLTVSADEAASLFTEAALGEVRLSWASPGESVRIVKILDAVEPRTKGPGGAGIFPGLLGPDQPQGTGQTHVLRGAAVVAAGFLPRAQEAVVDMTPPLAHLSPLANTHNLVVEFDPPPDSDWGVVSAGLRQGMLALAARLAEAALDAPPDHEDTLPPLRAGGRAGRGTDGLPRVGAITNLQTQGTFKETFVYGRSFTGALPTLLEPGELDDGAVVSGQFGHPPLKNPTYVYQNHPVAAALLERHGIDLEFAGVVISPEPVDQAGKELVSAQAARVCATAGFDAAVLTKEGGGNADADVALKMDRLEELGIAAVGLFAEMAGPDGTGPSIVVPPTRATAMVSTGNYDEKVELAEVERALGGDSVALVDQPATARMELPTAAFYGALSPLGWGRLTCNQSAATNMVPS